MANVTHIYGNELVDAAARQDIAELQTETTNLKEDLLSAFATDTASGSIASFPDGADNVPVKSLKVSIGPVQSGSGDPSPTNVRPISGHTQAVVMGAGQNIAVEAIHGYIKTDTQKVVINNDSESVVFFAKKGVTYTVSSSVSMTRSVVGLVSTDNIVNQTPIEQLIELSNSTDTWTATWTGWTVWYKCPRATSGFSESAQVVVGSTASTYAPYQGQTVTIDLDGTRYGGTLNATTGVLTVDRQIVDLGTLTWNYDSNNTRFFAKISDGKIYVGAVGQTMSVCSQYAYSALSDFASKNKVFCAGSGTISANTCYVAVKDTTYSDAASFKTAMNGVQLVYELAEPVTVQLTAQEVRTILGTNNIWSDAGNVDVEYRADTKLYIQKVLNA